MSVLQESKPQRKKYTQIVGKIDYYRRTVNPNCKQPPLWIDPDDIETVCQYAVFWRNNIANLHYRCSFMSQEERWKYQQMIRKCARTCSGQKYKQENNYLNKILQDNEGLFSHMKEKGEQNFVKGIKGFWLEQLRRKRDPQPEPQIIQKKSVKGSSIYEKSKLFLGSINQSILNIFSSRKKSASLQDEKNQDQKAE